MNNPDNLTVEGLIEKLADAVAYEDFFGHYGEPDFEDITWTSPGQGWGSGDDIHRGDLKNYVVKAINFAIQSATQELAGEVERLRASNNQLLESNLQLLETAQAQREEENALIRNREKDIDDLQSQLQQSETRVVELEKLIQDAPHDPVCWYVNERHLSAPCNCWKSKALAINEKEE